MNSIFRIIFIFLCLFIFSSAHAFENIPVNNNSLNIIQGISHESRIENTRNEAYFLSSTKNERILQYNNLKNNQNFSNDKINNQNKKNDELFYDESKNINLSFFDFPKFPVQNAIYARAP